MWHIHVQFLENFEGGLRGGGMSMPPPWNRLWQSHSRAVEMKKAVSGRKKVPQNRNETAYKCAQSVRRGHGLDFQAPYPPECATFHSVCITRPCCQDREIARRASAQYQTSLPKKDRTGTFSHAKRKIQGQVTPLVNPHRIGL